MHCLLLCFKGLQHTRKHKQKPLNLHLPPFLILLAPRDKRHRIHLNLDYRYWFLHVQEDPKLHRKVFLAWPNSSALCFTHGQATVPRCAESRGTWSPAQEKQHRIQAGFCLRHKPVSFSSKIQDGCVREMLPLVFWDFVCLFLSILGSNASI